MIISTINDFVKPAASGWNEVGNALAVTAGHIQDMQGMTSTRIATIGKGDGSDSSLRELRAYDHDGSDFSLTGNPFDTGLIFLGGIAALDSSTVVINGTFSGGDGYRTFSFDGSDWSSIDIDLNWFIGDIDAISSSNIVQVDRDSSQIFEEYTLISPGSGWDFVTDSADSYSSLEEATVCAMSSTLAAIVDPQIASKRGDLSAYVRSGGVWNQTGNILQSVSFASASFKRVPICELSSTRIALLSINDGGKIIDYDWDGSDFSVHQQLINGYSNTTGGAIGKLTSSSVATRIGGNLRRYDLSE